MNSTIKNAVAAALRTIGAALSVLSDALAEDAGDGLHDDRQHPASAAMPAVSAQIDVQDSPQQSNASRGWLTIFDRAGAAVTRFLVA